LRGFLTRSTCRCIAATKHAFAGDLDNMDANWAFRTGSACSSAYAAISTLTHLSLRSIKYSLAHSLTHNSFGITTDSAKLLILKNFQLNIDFI
jgi:hypothetical protein